MASNLPKVTKTKAHRSAAEAMVAGDADNFIGNYEADRLAREAADSVAPDEEDTEKVLQLWRNMAKLYRGVATMLAVWPLVREAIDQGS